MPNSHDKKFDKKREKPDSKQNVDDDVMMNNVDEKPSASSSSPTFPAWAFSLVSASWFANILPSFDLLLADG